MLNIRAMDKEDFILIYAAEMGVKIEDLTRNGIRAYKCPCKGDRCNGWQMIPDGRVSFLIKLGLVNQEDVDDYKEELGCDYIVAYQRTHWN